MLMSLPTPAWRLRSKSSKSGLSRPGFARSQNANVAHCLPNKLHKKAYEYQGDLTDVEPALLLSCGDLVERALVGQHSLSRKEHYKATERPNHNVVRSTVQCTSLGTVSEPAELHKKANEALERGELTSLNDEELKLVANDFFKEEAAMSFRNSAALGNGEAANLLFDIGGFDIQVIAIIAAFIHTSHALKARQTIQSSGGDRG